MVPSQRRLTRLGVDIQSFATGAGVRGMWRTIAPYQITSLRLEGAEEQRGAPETTPELLSKSDPSCRTGRKSKDLASKRLGTEMNRERKREVLDGQAQRSTN
jgi:hypothetical protein